MKKFKDIKQEEYYNQQIELFDDLMEQGMYNEAYRIMMQHREGAKLKNPFSLNIYSYMLTKYNKYLISI